MQGTFSSSFAVLLSMLGAVVGTGNIWRFPRIVANHATEGGDIKIYLNHSNYNIFFRSVGVHFDLVLVPVGVVYSDHPHRVWRGQIH